MTKLLNSIDDVDSIFSQYRSFNPYIFHAWFWDSEALTGTLEYDICILDADLLCMALLAFGAYLFKRSKKFPSSHYNRSNLSMAQDIMNMCEELSPVTKCAWCFMNDFDKYEMLYRQNEWVKAQLEGTERVY